MCERERDSKSADGRVNGKKKVRKGAERKSGKIDKLKGSLTKTNALRD